MFKYYLIFIIIMSLITFIMYAVDKAKSKRNAWRIKEATLLLLSFFGGAIGGYLAMISLHHKTKHWYFTLVNIFGVILHVVIGYLLLK
ncbi:MAG: DUF1294 domain-containing protein [Bacilli bacterium]|nr:DUF1294 domain-containing protein [Bacilli bacterium]